MKPHMLIPTLLIASHTLLLSAQSPELEISKNGHYLSRKDGTIVFLNGDTGWNLALMLSRNDAEHYIKVRKDQDFNLLGISAIHGNDPINYYGD
ncbi:MAG: DUF4038 domain-containing protein, partial [Bacteroidota bacterium]